MNLARAPLRIPRTLAVAGTVLSLAAAAHVFAGGELPAPPVLAALAALTTLAAAPLTGARLTAPVLAGYLLAGQFALHQAFSAMSGPAVSVARPAAHAHYGQILPAPGPDAALQVMPAADPAAAMLGLHVLATLATALVLARTEASLWAVAAWLRILIKPLVPGAMPPVLRLAVIGGRRPARRVAALGQVSARGPPLGVGRHAALPAILRRSRIEDPTMNLIQKQRVRLGLALAAGLLIPAVAAGPALAHDALQSTTPAADATVTSAPGTVSLTLSEPPTDSESLNLSVITVTDGEGKTLSDGKVTVTGATISTTVAPGANGPHKVLWRAVSSDGHPIEGSYSYTVQDPARTASAAPAPVSAAPSPAPTPASAAPDTTEFERVKPPNNDNALLTLGVAAAVIAALAGVLFLGRHKRARNRDS